MVELTTLALLGGGALAGGIFGGLFGGKKGGGNVYADQLRASMQAQLAEAQASRAVQERLAATQERQLAQQGDMMSAYLKQIEDARAETAKASASAEEAKRSREALDAQQNPETPVRNRRVGGRSLFTNAWAGFARAGDMAPA